jgi:hypothetical protein
MAWSWQSKQWAGWWEFDDRSRGGDATDTGGWQDRVRVAVPSDAANSQNRSRDPVLWQSDGNDEAQLSWRTTSPHGVRWDPTTSLQTNPPSIPLVVHLQGNPSGDTTLPSPNVNPADPVREHIPNEPESQQAATDQAEALEQEEGIEWESGGDYWRHPSGHLLETRKKSISPSSGHDGSSAHDGSHESSSDGVCSDRVRMVRRRLAMLTAAAAPASPKHVALVGVGPLEVASRKPQSRPGDDRAALRHVPDQLDADPKVLTAMYFHHYRLFTQQLDTTEWWQQHSAALKFFREETEKLDPVPMVQHFPLYGTVTRARIIHPPGTSFSFDRTRYWAWDWKEFVSQLRPGDIDLICAGPHKTSDGIVGCSLQRTEAYDDCRHVASSSTAAAASCFQWHLVVTLSDGSCASLHPAWSSVNVSLNWAAATDIMDDEVPAAGVGMSDGHGTFTYFKNKHVDDKLKFDKSKTPQGKASPPCMHRPMPYNFQTAVAEQAPKANRPPPEPKGHAPPTQPPTQQKAPPTHGQPATQVPPVNIQKKSPPPHAYALHGAPALPHPPGDTERGRPPQRANPPFKANQPMRSQHTVVGGLAGGVTPSAIPPQALSQAPDPSIEDVFRLRTPPPICNQLMSCNEPPAMPEISDDDMPPLHIVGYEGPPEVAAVADAIMPPNEEWSDTSSETTRASDSDAHAHHFTWYFPGGA